MSLTQAQLAMPVEIQCGMGALPWRASRCLSLIRWRSAEMGGGDSLGGDRSGSVGLTQGFDAAQAASGSAASCHVLGAEVVCERAAADFDPVRDFACQLTIFIDVA